MRGTRLRTEAPFAELFAPVAGRFKSLFWYLDVQAGPFDSLLTTREEQAELDELHIAVPWLEASSVTLWRPGVFPRHAARLVQDEWSYLVGLPGPEITALASAKRLLPLSPLSPKFFRAVSSVGGTFLVRVRHGWWEAYGLAEDAAGGLGGEPVTSSHWPMTVRS